MSAQQGDSPDQPGSAGRLFGEELFRQYEEMQKGQDRPGPTQSWVNLSDPPLGTSRREHAELDSDSSPGQSQGSPSNLQQPTPQREQAETDKDSSPGQSHGSSSDRQPRRASSDPPASPGSPGSRFSNPQRGPDYFLVNPSSDSAPTLLGSGTYFPSVDDLPDTGQEDPDPESKRKGPKGKGKEVAATEEPSQQDPDPVIPPPAAAEPSQKAPDPVTPATTTTRRRLTLSTVRTPPTAATQQPTALPAWSNPPPAPPPKFSYADVLKTPRLPKKR